MNNAQAAVVLRLNSKTRFTAKRDFVIQWNDYYREIKKGEDVSDVPSMFWENLKTEKVI